MFALLQLNDLCGNLFSVDYLKYEQSATVEFDILEDGSASNFEIIKFPNLNF